jgi:hypothetical protein
VIDTLVRFRTRWPIRSIEPGTTLLSVDTGIVRPGLESTLAFDDAIRIASSRATV